MQLGLLRRFIVFQQQPCRYYASYKQLHRREERDKVVYSMATKNTKRAQRLYGFGFTPTGALGVKDFVMPSAKSRIKQQLHCIHKPTRLAFFADNNLHVGPMACGFGFSVFGCKLPQNKWQLYGCGLNSDSQLGQHLRSVRGQVGGKRVELLLEPTVIRLCQQSDGGDDSSSFSELSLIACGRAHTLVAGRSSPDSSVDRLWSMGNNTFGQCARPIVPGEKFGDSPIINVIPLPEGVSGLEQVVCGQDHSLVLSSEGHVFSCGLGSDGQTGLGSYENVDRLTRVQGDISTEKIVHISSRGDTILAVSSRGDVFGWGNSEYDQLPSAQGEMQQNTPRHIPMPSEAGKILEAASAGSMCGVRDDKGQVLVWGYGQLGVGLGPSAVRVAQPTPLPRPLFGAVDGVESSVTSLTCGLHHLAAITSTGGLYTWGANRSGCLGQGTNEEGQSFPYSVTLPGQVDRVICGIDHTIVVARAFA